MPHHTTLKPPTGPARRSPVAQRADRTHVRPVVPPVMTNHISGRHGPSGASHLLWHERVVTAVGASVQLTIPLVGRYDTDLGIQLATRLDHLWTDQPRPGGERITSVSTIIGQQDGQSFLMLFLSLDSVPNGHRIDDHRMARHLRIALQQSLPSDDPSSAALAGAASASPPAAHRRFAPRGRGV